MGEREAHGEDPVRLAVHLQGHVQGQATERAWLGLVRVSSGDGASDIGFALLAVLDRASSPS